MQTPTTPRENISAKTGTFKRLQTDAQKRNQFPKGAGGVPSTQASKATIEKSLGSPKRTDPACIKTYRQVVQTHPDAMPVRGIFATNLQTAQKMYHLNIATGTQKQLGGFTHLKAYVNGRYIDNSPQIPKGAQFFSEKEIRKQG